MKSKLLQLAFIILAAVTASAQAPQKFNYQGVARSTTGAPLASATIGLRLTIHDGSSSGAIVYQETHAPVTNAFGLYNVAVGGGTVVSGTFNTIAWGSGDKYLEVEIDPAGGSAYTSAGNNQLLSVPYALNAANAPLVSGTTNYVPKFTSSSALGNSSIFDNGATVGINTTTPSAIAKLHVSSTGTYSGSAGPVYHAGIVADGGSSATSASGIYGVGGWRGVFGFNPGVASGSEAIGVLGRLEGSSYTSGFGVKGENAGKGTATNYGLYGTVSAMSGTAIGVYGNGNTAGLYGRGGSAGAYGTANGSGAVHTTFFSAHVAGVVGQVRTVASGRPAGVMAVAANTGSTGQSGLIALADSCSSNYGVEAYAAHAGSTGSNYGVYAYIDATGASRYAGYFAGPLYATSASSSIKSFKIDHPADPANKYLYHSSVESNDMMNLYNGNVTTDANGDATVTLPVYFSMLNKDFKYQLTCIGQFAQAIVAEEITGNHFRIKTDKPNVKVSWMVSGVRQDAAANAYRVKDEVEKPGPEKGTYLNPELYGYGPEMMPGYKNSSRGRNAATGNDTKFPGNINPQETSSDNKR